MRVYVLDDEYKAVTGQQTRFYTEDECIEAACKWTRVRNRPLKIWEYDNQVRSLIGAVQPDGTLVKPPKDVAEVAAALCDRGHTDLADELLDN